MNEGKHFWFPLYVSEWLLVAVKHGLTLAAQGSYMRLLCFQWDNGGLPDDEPTLSRFVGSTPQEFAGIWREIAQFFPVGDDGQRRNQNLETVRAAQNERSEKARLLAAKRWGNRPEGDAPEAPKPAKKKTPKATPPPKEAAPKPPPDPNDPYSVIERILTAVSEKLGGSPVTRPDCLRYLKKDSPVLSMAEMFGEAETIAIYLFAAESWNNGASWSGVYAQRDAIRLQMNGGARKVTARKTVADRAAELGV
jgi:uncharacterized protein YdaU (DUF1376 family)